MLAVNMMVIIIWTGTTSRYAMNNSDTAEAWIRQRELVEAAALASGGPGVPPGSALAGKSGLQIMQSPIKQRARYAGLGRIRHGARHGRQNSAQGSAEQDTSTREAGLDALPVIGCSQSKGVHGCRS